MKNEYIIKQKYIQKRVRKEERGKRIQAKKREKKNLAYIIKIKNKFYKIYFKSF